jgi:hypothetical protein
MAMALPDRRAVGRAFYARALPTVVAALLGSFAEST